jgi:hypothetical protein
MAPARWPLLRENRKRADAVPLLLLLVQGRILEREDRRAAVVGEQQSEPLLVTKSGAAASKQVVHAADLLPRQGPRWRGGRIMTPQRSIGGEPGS